MTESMEITCRESSALTIDGRTYILADDVGNLFTTVIDQTVRPAMDVLTKLCAQNTQMIQNIAAQQETQARMMEEMRRSFLLSTPMTRQQVKELKNRITAKAEKLISAQGVTSKKVSNKLASIIRQDVKKYFSVGSLADISRAEYKVAAGCVDKWFDVRKIMEVVKT